MLLSGLLLEQRPHLLGILEPQLDFADFSFLEVHLRHEVLSEFAILDFEGSSQQTAIVDAPPVSDREILTRLILT
jgi:hypothetical protein